MKRLICILISVNLIITVAFVLFVNNNGMEESSGAIYISRRNPEDIQKIEVSKKEESYIFVFDKEWICRDVPDAKLNQDAVGELLYDTAVISALGVVEKNAVSIDKYGIGDEKIKVTYKDGGEFSYSFGNKIINSNRYYFYSHDQNTVYAVTAQKKKALFKSLNEYRQITAIKCDTENISKIKFGDILIGKTDGVYKSISPHKAILDEDKVKEFLYKNFIEISMEDIFDNPENIDRSKCIEITISDIYGTEDRFLLYLNDGKYYMYIESENISKRIDKTLMDTNLSIFWDRHIFGADIKSAKITSADREYVLNTEEVSSLSEIAAVDFGKRISDNFLADILVEGKNVCEYKIYKYNLRYVLVFDGFGEFLVTAESLDDILKNVVN